VTCKVLMVDVDGVVIAHPNPAGWAANLEQDLGLSVERLHARFFRPHFADIVHGRARLRDRLTPVLLEIAPDLTCDVLIQYWFEHDACLDQDLLAQLAAARERGIEIHLATVQEHERAAYIWDTMGLRDHCDAMHYAAALGAAKPAAAFFIAIENRTGFEPSEICFIDDKSENVEAARLRGWSAAVWKPGDRLDALFAGMPTT
jgi:putative hydrolase of the HAD superfamily